MKMAKQICAGMLMASLAACGPMSEGGIAATLAGLVKARVLGTPTVATPAQSGPSPEQIVANPGKFIRINIRNTGQWVTVVQAELNAGRTTWASSDNKTVTFENGLVVATRGLSRDLMAADATETRRAIRAGGGNSQRRHEFLTNLDGISEELLQCSIASKGSEIIELQQKSLNTVKFEEECRSEGLQFTNVYWVNRAGKIVRSLQAVSPDAGYLQIDVF